MWASTRCPFCSSTRNIALGSGSTTRPSTSMAPSFFAMPDTASLVRVRPRQDPGWTLVDCRTRGADALAEGALRHAATARRQDGANATSDRTPRDDAAPTRPGDVLE